MSNRLILAALVLGACGCGSAPPGRQCMNTGTSSDLVKNAALMRVDVYAAGVICDGNYVAAGSSAPLMSRSFATGEAISLDIPPGPHTVVITVFGDAAGTVELGGTCTTSGFEPGQKVCLDSMLLPAPPDMSVGVDLFGLDLFSCVESDCPFNHHCGPTGLCEPGCKQSSECAQLASGSDGGAPGDGGMMATNKVLCDLTQHRCVECIAQADCASGKICNPSGNCVVGCDPSKGKLCTGGQTCCNLLCTDTTTDPLNCGACGRACSTASVSSLACAGSLCTSGCSAGFGNCTRPVAPAADDGCETPTTTIANCGGCGNTCTLNNASVATCMSNQCSYTCNTNFGDCVKTGANLDGCETPTNTITNCAGCGNVCNTSNSNGPACNGTKCTYTSCKANRGNCDTTGVDINGCETTTNTTTNCGGCGNVCNSATSAGATCNGTTCQYSGCSASYANCAMTAPDTNGCETPTTTTANCSGCGITCDTATSVGASCSGTKCNYTGCAGGYANCNSTTPDSNGCETPTTTTSNCAGCGNVCDTANSVGAACSGTKCTYTGCNSGRTNCNSTGIDTNGCECETTPGAPACCAGSTCQVKHSTAVTGGISPNWFDCVALDTYNVTQATAACNAWIGGRPPTASGGWGCYDITCGQNTRRAICAEVHDAMDNPVCTVEGSPCWGYQGSVERGRAFLDPTCLNCPSFSVGDPIWH